MKWEMKNEEFCTQWDPLELDELRLKPSNWNPLKKQLQIIDNDNDFLNSVIKEITFNQFLCSIEFSITINPTEANFLSLSSIEQWGKSQGLLFIKFHNILSFELPDSQGNRQKMYNALLYIIHHHQALPNDVLQALKKNFGKVYSVEELRQELIKISTLIARVLTLTLSETKKQKIISKHLSLATELIELSEASNLKGLRIFLVNQLLIDLPSEDIAFHFLGKANRAIKEEFYEAKLLQAEMLMMGLQIPSNFVCAPLERKIFVEECRRIFSYLNQIQKDSNDDPQIRLLAFQATILKEKILLLSCGQNTRVPLKDKLEDLIKEGKIFNKSKIKYLDSTLIVSPTDLMFKFARMGLKLKINTQHWTKKSSIESSSKFTP